jgi:hypothetical protein
MIMAESSDPVHSSLVFIVYTAITDRRYQNGHQRRNPLRNYRKNKSQSES